MARLLKGSHLDHVGICLCWPLRTTAACGLERDGVFESGNETCFGEEWTSQNTFTRALGKELNGLVLTFSEARQLEWK
jgi:hypothetical protein